MAVAPKKLDFRDGDVVEIEGRRYDVVPDKQGGLTLEPAITVTMEELRHRYGTRPATQQEIEERSPVCCRPTRASASGGRQPRAWRSTRPCGPMRSTASTETVRAIAARSRPGARSKRPGHPAPAIPRPEVGSFHARFG